MPRVALTLSYTTAPTDELDQWRVNGYLDAIRVGGCEATPLYLDEWESRVGDVVREFDGLVLAGGADLAPSWYGEAPLENANLDIVNARRPCLETRLLDDFWKARKPVLGICYGCQFMAVWRGGGLIQDIALQEPAASDHRGGIRHFVCVAPNTQLAQVFGESEFAVPSYHHQAIRHAGEGAVISAHAREDDIIEAVEWPEQPFFLGVQWHPERAPDSTPTQRLFRALCAACG